MTTDRVVQMFDDSGAKRDKFSTKPAQSDGPKNFVVRGMAFSPCSTKLAIGQSDNIVFVYKLGAEWGDKKSICNKFLQHHPVTALAWPAERGGELAFATADGKVRVGALKTNKATTLYAHPEQSYVVSLCASPDGNGVCSGHLDGSVFVFSFVTGIATKLATHACAPYGLAWGKAPAPADAFPITSGSREPRADRGGVIACAGADKKLTFYDARGEGGRAKQTFDHGADDPESSREFSCASFAKDGETLAVGSFDAFHVYGVDPRRRVWVLKTKKQVPNLYTVSALAWRGDGARLAVGALRGNVDVYDACARRRRLKTRAGDAFDVTFTSHAAFSLTRTRDDAKVLVRTKTGMEIAFDSVTVKRDRYVVARTPKTVLLADLETGLVSEAEAKAFFDESVSTSSRRSKGLAAFDFDADERSCVVRDVASGELAVIEYGVDGYIGTARASSVAPELVSLRVRPPRDEKSDSGVKKMAYPVDAQTLRVDRLLGDGNDDDTDDTSASASASVSRGVTVSHGSRVDWLELNARATHLLFRDKKRRLHLACLASGTKSSLLEHVTYAQWVPGADVIVAQATNTRSLCVWYSLDAPEKVSHVPARGDVESIERADGVTTVTLRDEGLGSDTSNDTSKKAAVSVVTLDESLVAFNTLLEEGALFHAANALEPSLRMHGGVTPETEPMWAELSRGAEKRGDAATARRCAAALGNVARADFLLDEKGLLFETEENETFTLNDDDEKNDDKENDDVRTKTGGEVTGGESARTSNLASAARLAMLDRRFGDAESLLLSRGRVAAAVAMWRCLGRLDNAAACARRAGRDEHAEQLAREHLEWLKSTGQEEAAGVVLEKRGDSAGAVRLFLKGGVPGRAAALAIDDAKRDRSMDARVVEEICDALKRASMHAKAGELFDALGRVDEALEHYAAGDAFADAAALLRRHPGKARGLYSLSSLYARWGDHLMHKGGASNAKEATHHYVEAGDIPKAVESALEAGEAETALEILDADSNHQTHAASYLRLAKHYERSGSFAAAEACFLKGFDSNGAVEMHARHDNWDAARRVAERSGDAGAVSDLYARRGRALEARASFADAETAYVAADRHDLAIAMYEKHRLFDHQLRLIGQRHGAEALKAARSKLALALAEEGSREKAERLYAENGDWRLAVKMYRDAGAWEEAVRAARAGGGGAASKQVAYAWARSLDGPEEGAALLKKFGLLDAGVEHACAGGDFEHALSLAKHGGYKSAQIKEVCLKRALFLEDEGKFGEAEVAFIEADKPKEAIEMYSHAEDWEGALRVAESFAESAPELVPETLRAHADALLKKLTTRSDDTTPEDTLNTMRHAERLFIKANRADLAIGAYRERGAWDDAIRVAADYAPRRVLELENERRRTLETNPRESSSAASHESSSARRKVEALVEKASSLEASGDYAGAVDAYLEVHRKAFGASPSADEKATMTKAWRAAVKLAGERVPGKTRAVVSEAAYRIRKLGDAAAADDLLAVHGVSPAEARERYAPGAAAAGAAVSKKAAASSEADALAVSKNASSASSEADALKRAAHAARSGDGATGASTLAALPRGPPVDAERFGVYEDIAASALAFALEEGDADDAVAAAADAEAYLTRLVDSMRATPDVHADALRAFRDLREAAHLLRVSLTATKPKHAEASGMKSVAAKAATSALRLASRLPADAAFFRAGALCRAAGDTNSAFVFLNRFLDIADAVDDAAEASFDSVSPSPRKSASSSKSASKSLRALDNDDFGATDVPPPERLTLPSAHAVDEKSREEARDWVLTVSMDRAVTQQLPERACAKCGGSTFAGALKCHRCGAESERCAVTGWPVPPGERVDAGGGRGAKRADWDAWANAVGTDPWDPAGKAATEYR